MSEGPLITDQSELRALLGHPPFLLYVGGKGLADFSGQMMTVAIGWQLYALTQSAFALGLVGLVQFIPTALLIFIAGHTADRFPRPRVARTCQIAKALTAAGLAWGSSAGWLTAPEIFIAVILVGTASAFEGPAASALLPGVTPTGALPRAAAVSTGAFQAAAICGPALGGLAYAVIPSLPYALAAGAWLVASMLIGSIRLDRPITGRVPPTPAVLFAGVRFVRRHPAILGTISLDLFAVLLGGATTLLPIYARDILATGPWGLGILRSAPAAGALLMTLFIAHHAIERRAGLRMLQAVVGFGLATVVFGLSRELWLSVLALAVLGAADTVSMVIRIALVQIATPDDMRGRVGAVNALFVNASYQLGGFESGVTAALLGAVPSVVLGGIGTVLVALLWMKLFPTLRDVDRLE